VSFEIRFEGSVRVNRSQIRREDFQIEERQTCGYEVGRGDMVLVKGGIAALVAITPIYDERSHYDVFVVCVESRTHRRQSLKVQCWPS